MKDKPSLPRGHTTYKELYKCVNCPAFLDDAFPENRYCVHHKTHVTSNREICSAFDRIFHSYREAQQLYLETQEKNARADRTEKKIQRLKKQAAKKEKERKKEETTKNILDKRRKEVDRWIEILGIDSSCVVTVYPLPKKGEKQEPVQIPVRQLEEFGLKTIKRAFGTGCFCGLKECILCNRKIRLFEKQCPYCGTRQNVAGWPR